MVILLTPRGWWSWLKTPNHHRCRTFCPSCKTSKSSPRFRRHARTKKQRKTRRKKRVKSINNQNVRIEYTRQAYHGTRDEKTRRHGEREDVVTMNTWILKCLTRGTWRKGSRNGGRRHQSSIKIVRQQKNWFQRKEKRDLRPFTRAREIGKRYTGTVVERRYWLGYGKVTVSGCRRQYYCPSARLCVIMLRELNFCSTDIYTGVPFPITYIFHINVWAPGVLFYVFTLSELLGKPWSHASSLRPVSLASVFTRKGLAIPLLVDFHRIPQTHAVALSSTWERGAETIFLDLERTGYRTPFPMPGRSIIATNVLGLPRKFCNRYYWQLRVVYSDFYSSTYPVICDPVQAMEQAALWL